MEIKKRKLKKQKPNTKYKMKRKNFICCFPNVEQEHVETLIRLIELFSDIDNNLDEYIKFIYVINLKYKLNMDLGYFLSVDTEKSHIEIPEVGILERLLLTLDPNQLESIVCKVIEYFKVEIKSDPLHKCIHSVVDLYCLTFGDELPKSNYQYIDTYRTKIFLN